MASFRILKQTQNVQELERIIAARALNCEPLSCTCIFPDVLTVFLIYQVRVGAKLKKR